MTVLSCSEGRECVRESITLIDMYVPLNVEMCEYRHCSDRTPGRAATHVCAYIMWAPLASRHPCLPAHAFLFLVVAAEWCRPTMLEFQSKTYQGCHYAKWDRGS